MINQIIMIKIYKNNNLRIIYFLKESYLLVIHLLKVNIKIEIKKKFIHNIQYP